MKLSIIIPYYNTYELTEELLKELLKQDNEEIEIILIDDGCNETRFDEIKGFKNLRVIHQENHGLAFNRNEGVRQANGEYIAYVDSDDMITPDYVETLLNTIKNSPTDVIKFNWIDINTKQEYKRPTNPAVWKAIYKKDKMIPFEEGHLYGGEDLYFTQKIENRVNNGEYTITYIDKVLYMYNSVREGSYTWQFLHREEL